MKVITAIKKYILTSLLAVVSLSAYAQQTLQFSQYMFTGLAVNPAYAGYKEAWTANVNYRMQWTGIENAPRTGTLSLDGVTNARNKNMGLGIIATSDRLGPEIITSVYANYAYRIRLDDLDTRRFSFGIGLGAVKYSLDVSKFSATNISDNAIPSGDQSKLSPDIRAGIYYYSPQFYVGASAINLLSASGLIDSYTTTRQVRHFYLTAGGLIPINDYLDWKPSFLYKEDFKGPANLDLSNSVLISQRIWAGVTYRTGVNFFNRTGSEDNVKASDAMAAILEWYCNSNLRIGYSFDFTTSKLASSQNGSHEISVSFNLTGRRSRLLSPRYF